MPKKSEIERNAREETREKIQWWSLSWWSGSSGSGHIAGGQGLLMVGARSKGLAPSPFTSFRCPSHRFPKVLENDSIGLGREGVLVVSHPCPEGKCSAFLPT